MHDRRYTTFDLSIMKKVHINKNVHILIQYLFSAIFVKINYEVGLRDSIKTKNICMSVVICLRKI